MSYAPYAGIGSRQTPPDVLAHMEATAGVLDTCGYTLRSGGAAGADRAFEAGVRSGRKEIFVAEHGIHRAALKLAAQFHPAWEKCTAYARLLHARNCLVILGRDLDDPVRFVICWTPGGQLVGGTAQAIRVARHHGIPVHNWGPP